VNAVRCAVDIQRAMIDREPEVAEASRIRFRIGINLGDVIVEQHDIFGDGVNIAARLETWRSQELSASGDGLLVEFSSVVDALRCVTMATPMCHRSAGSSSA
jgi:class 3 adenylate cyclase